MKEEILKIMWDNSRKDPHGSWEKLFDAIADDIVARYKSDAPSADLQRKINKIQEVLNEHG